MDKSGIGQGGYEPERQRDISRLQRMIVDHNRLLVDLLLRVSKLEGREIVTPPLPSSMRDL